MWYTTEDARRDAAKQAAQRDKMPTPKQNVNSAHYAWHYDPPPSEEELIVSEKSECRMEMVEDAELNITWECSCCGKAHKDSKSFEKKKTCPACGAPISEFIGLYDDDED